METVNNMVSGKPVVMFSKSSCCMSHSLKTMLYKYGVNLKVYELDEMSSGVEIELALSQFGGANPIVPAVFIGGEFIGGANEVLSLHIAMTLRPMLIQARALWV